MSLIYGKYIHMAAKPRTHKGTTVAKVKGQTGLIIQELGYPAEVLLFFF